MALRSVVVKVDLARRMANRGRAAEVKAVAVEVVAADVVDAVVIMAAETEAGDARTVTVIWTNAESDPA
jgi:hypothetical protein